MSIKASELNLLGKEKEEKKRKKRTKEKKEKKNFFVHSLLQFQPTVYHLFQ